jgi:hypothetical protein
MRIGAHTRFDASPVTEATELGRAGATCAFQHTDAAAKVARLAWHVPSTATRPHPKLCVPCLRTSRQDFSRPRALLNQHVIVVGVLTSIS